MKRIMLTDNWRMREEPITRGPAEAALVAAQGEGWYENISLPVDARMPLIEHGVIGDPVLADYYKDSAWVEDRSWWFGRDIDGSMIDGECDIAELVLGGLDCHADIFLNGIHLGHHESSFYPFRMDVKKYLHPGVNKLLVRLTTGLEYVNAQMLAEAAGVLGTDMQGARGDKRRIYLRKAQYCYGWDWCERAGSCAIAGDAYIECSTYAAIRAVSVQTVCIEGGNARLRAVVETEGIDFIRSGDYDVRVELSMAGKMCAAAEKKDLILLSGQNYAELDILLPDAQLWWPNGMGGQPLYDVGVTATVRGRTIECPAFKCGVRTVELCTDREDEHNRKFTLRVNGIDIFCKGADWIPADLVYARVTPEKYARLIGEAKEANFNMLRIWGGGIYEPDCFYEECDKNGILIWQDMMFSCALYPDHLDSFTRLVEKEFDYQTRRLRNHACLALFCGNNEDHWLYGIEGSSSRPALMEYERQLGMKVANITLPRVMRLNCPHIPFWNSSPYGGDEPNADNVGDVHHWHACMMNEDMEKRVTPEEYDRADGRFVSEYGYIGPCDLKTIEQYFDGREIDRGSEIWNIHNNTFEKKTVNYGIKKHYTDRELDLREYLLYAGMTQALMYGYSLEALRYRASCSGALFWMYNDCWGEVGWTVIDYYLRRKPSFYAAKRAFEPLKLIIRAKNGRAEVVGINESNEDTTLDLEYGFIGLDGLFGIKENKPVTLPCRSRGVMCEFPAAGQDVTRGMFYARPDRADIRPATLRILPMRELILPAPRFAAEFSDDGKDLRILIQAQTYIHGLHFYCGELLPSDSYFDMLPGERREVIIKGGAGARPEIKTVLPGQL